MEPVSSSIVNYQQSQSVNAPHFTDIEVSALFPFEDAATNLPFSLVNNAAMGCFLSLQEMLNLSLVCKSWYLPAKRAAYFRIVSQLKDLRQDSIDNYGNRLKYLQRVVCFGEFYIQSVPHFTRELFQELSTHRFLPQTAEWDRCLGALVTRLVGQKRILESLGVWAMMLCPKMVDKTAKAIARKFSKIDMDGALCFIQESEERSNRSKEVLNEIDYKSGVLGVYDNDSYFLSRNFKERFINERLIEEVVRRLLRKKENDKIDMLVSISDDTAIQVAKYRSRRLAPDAFEERMQFFQSLGDSIKWKLIYDIFCFITMGSSKSREKWQEELECLLEIVQNSPEEEYACEQLTHDLGHAFFKLRDIPRCIETWGRIELDDDEDEEFYSSLDMFVDQLEIQSQEDICSVRKFLEHKLDISVEGRAKWTNYLEKVDEACS